MNNKDDDLELRVSKTEDGKYKMVISKEYSAGSKRELISEMNEDMQALVRKFEQYKESLRNNEGNERE